MAEEQATATLIDENKRTLYHLERYFWQRRERIEWGKKNDQDWFLDLLCDFITSQDDELSETDDNTKKIIRANRKIHDDIQRISRKMQELENKIAPQKKEPMPRTMQMAKERCQALAKYLWNQHPDMTQEDMARHEAIYNLTITDGKRYEIETVKEWVAKVDPRPAEKKRGRPRKAKK